MPTLPRWLATAMAVAAAVTLPTSTAHATDVLFTDLALSPITRIKDLDMADFDGDGDLDRAYVQTTLWWNENVDGDGSSWAGHTIHPTELWGAAPADVDGDGDLDLFSGHFQGVSWHENVTGDGSSWTTHTISTSPGASPAAGDMDQDGFIDVVAAVGPDLTWYENAAGDGSSWVPHAFIHHTFCSVVSIALGDLDGDGDPDIVTSEGLQITPSTDVASVTSWMNAGGAGQWFAQALIAPATEGEPAAIALADLDADGSQDIVQGEGNTVVWRSSLGTGHFGPSQLVLGSLDSPPASLAIADLDQDQDLDVVATTWSSLSWSENTGAGWLPQPITAPSFVGNPRVDCGDVNQDGVPDVTVTGHETFTPYFSLRNDNPWANLDLALAGTHGLPKLIGGGSLAGATEASVELSGALENATVALIAGVTAINAPFKGGVLVPSPDVVLAGLLSDGAGDLALSGTWPVGIPSGTDSFFQFWVSDPSAPQGFSSSNALRGTTP
jgi:hypothetical protein